MDTKHSFSPPITKYNFFSPKKRKLGKVRPSRTSIRKKIYLAISNAAKNRKSYLRISRTVEQIDQTKANWRAQTSKLMFMVALGLTPKEGWKGLPQPEVKLVPANPALVAKIEERYKVERAQRLQALREKQKADQERLMRLVQFSRGAKYSSSVGTCSVSSKVSSVSSDASSSPDVIDLVSDDESNSPKVISQLGNPVNKVAARKLPLQQTPTCPAIRDTEDKMRKESLFKWLNGTSSSNPPQKTVEVVDLASDDDLDKLYILPNYPNLHLTMVK